MMIVLSFDTGAKRKNSTIMIISSGSSTRSRRRQ